MDLPRIDIPTLQVPKPIAGSGGHRFIDGDTLVNEEGNLLRIEGLSAPEIRRLMDSGYLKPGTPGGLEATKQIEELANQFGYNNVKYLTNEDGSPKLDVHGRQLVRLSDEYGRDFTETLTRYGINKLSRYSSEEEIDKYRWGLAQKSNANLLDKPLNNFEKSALILDDAVKSEQWYDTEFAKAALNETELSRLTAERQPGESLAAFSWRMKEAAKYTGARVQQRHKDRTLDNQALHPWAEGFDIGWNGVIESLYGAAELLGEKTGFNWLENLGEAGIKRQREYLLTKPELKLNILKPVLDDDGKVIANEWDVDGIGEFFEYTGNMMAVSIPYMGVTAAGTMLAPATGGTSLAAATGIGAMSGVGLSMVAPVAMYTGMTWNDMEGENKSAILAAAGGITMSVLDRLGIRALMGTMTGTLLSPKYRKEMVKAYITKHGGTESAAKAAIAQMSRMEAAKLVGHAAKVAKDQLTYGNILRSFAARAGIGFGIESMTETGQELAQYLAATYGSDKPFDTVELHNRLVNAFVAGGTLGSAFSVPGTAYDVGAWTDVHVRKSPAEDKRKSKESKMQLEEEAHLHSYWEEGDTLPEGVRVGDIKQKYVHGKPKSIQDIYTDLKKGAQHRADSKAAEIQTLQLQLSDPQLPTEQRTAIIARIKALREATNLQTKKAAGRKQLKDREVWQKIKDAAAAFPVLWRGATRHYFTDANEKSPEVRHYSSGLGAFLHPVYSGETLENFKHNTLTFFKNVLGQVEIAPGDKRDFSAAAVAAALGYKTLDTLKISKDVYEFYQNLLVRDSKGNIVDSILADDIDWDTMPKHIVAKKDFYYNLAKRFDKFSKQLFDDQKNSRIHYYNPDGTVDTTSDTGKTFTMGEIKNYIGRYRSIDKVKIEKDKEGFIKDLIEHKKYTRAEATKLANAILDNDELIDENSLFEVGKGVHIPSQHRNRKLNMADDPVLSKWMEQDLFINISNAAKSAARYITYQRFIGDDGEILNEGIERAIESGSISREEGNAHAAFIQDYLDGESGNYKKIQNPRIANLQKNLLVWTTLAGLPMATISSLVEYMMISRALSPEQINNVIKASAKEFAGAIWETMTTATPNMKLATSVQGQLAKEKRQARLKRLGYFTWDTGAAQTTGATENTFASRYLLDKYFRIILLQQWTDMTRNIRGAQADDFIMHHLSIIRDQRTKGTLYDNEVQESEEHLRNLGINIEELLEIDSINVKKPDNKSWEEFLLEQRQAGSRLDRILADAEYNFINEAVALPGTANRPLFYQNPHLALFTQFQGFIATFTANHIPRMWGDYVKRGTPSMKYNAFAIITLMIAMGFVSQYLKDLLKYGGSSPYLDSMEKLQRGLGASGMLGVAERPLNFFFPIYETSSSNMIEEIFHGVSGEAAAISNLSKAATGATQIIEGALTDKSMEPGLYKGFKTAPLTGPFNQFNRWAASRLSGVFEN